MKKPYSIIIPFYKTSLNPHEEIALKQCFNVFKNRNIIAIKPKSLDLSFLDYQFNFSEIISFDDIYFANISGYNKLMISNNFYSKFIQFEYILIYQTDAFVFKDELDHWCSKGFDYIGAPWLYPLENDFILNQWIFKLKGMVYNFLNIHKNKPHLKQLYNMVGNGGLSLRRVEKFHELSISQKKICEKYTEMKNLKFNEDIFWSIEMNRKIKRLNIPDYKTALQFSIETFPDFAFNLNNNQLPFGCHGWEKNLDFWRPIFSKNGYKI